jgi:hypothetical protein
MVQPQLSIRSARAKRLAHRLAKEERRSVAQVVEQALEHYARAKSRPRKESGADFWERIAREGRTEGEPDVDLDAIIAEHRRPPRPVKF